ncbi:hypothetical protein C4D60_Mb02t22020 [Musa balbisiana]|uniref:Uncharacterized protein n=1 Tax=Musa balbisiana TaxID=52838 RepID=A0A4S8ICL8_MUSBA|nr:hypothetical protein C4D60_Mb02t22020 [Musa balbisiana]
MSVRSFYTIVRGLVAYGFDMMVCGSNNALAFGERGDKGVTMDVLPSLQKPWFCVLGSRSNNARFLSLAFPRTHKLLSFYPAIQRQIHR